MTALRAAFGAVLVLLLSGCGGASTPSAPTVTAADSTFVRHMLPHHQRAIAAGALAAQQGSDPRVRAFGQRIVAEQTPEEQRLAEWVATLHLSQQPSDAMAADGYIDDAALTRLQTEVDTVFDRDVLLLSARSEIGAAGMARTELAAGTYPPARTLAQAISGAPQSEIPELQVLAAALPS